MDYKIKCEVCGLQEQTISLHTQEFLGKSVNEFCPNCSPRFGGARLPHRVLPWRSTKIMISLNRGVTLK